MTWPARWCAGVGMVWGAAFACAGAVLSAAPSADTSLMEVAPTNNNGAQGWLLSGTTQNTPNTRALLRFDLSMLPTNTVVRSAQVILSVTREPSDGLANAPFGLHQMLRSWAEGAQASITTPGQGAPAEAGETTWAYRFYPTVPWAFPGGAPGTDFVPAQSTFQYVYGMQESPYLFESTPEMMADVQGWIFAPEENFGWMLLCAEEGIIFTARRFGSREDEANAPVLEVDYVVPPRFEEVTVKDGNVQLHFTAYPGHAYELEFQSAPGQPWQHLRTYEPAPGITQVSFEEPRMDARFYRLIAR